MSENYELKQKKDFVYLVFHEAFNVENLYQLCEETQSFARKTNCSKILVDHSKIPVELSPHQYFEIGVAVAKYFLGFRIAFLLQSFVKDALTFGETAAKNRGAAVSIFTSLEKACDWLGVEATSI